MVLAARGARETTEGTEPIEDERLVAALRARSRRIWLGTLAVTILASATVLAW